MTSLNLGCADDLRKDYVNVDIVRPVTLWKSFKFVQTDLNARWPWPDGSISHVRAHDIFEHLTDKLHTMSELHRVLEPGGTVDITLPNAAIGAGAFQNPTHRTYWTANDFEYYESGNPHYIRFAHAYNNPARFVNIIVTRSQYLGKFGDVVEKLTVHLEKETS